MKLPLSLNFVTMGAAFLWVDKVTKRAPPSMLNSFETASSNVEAVTLPPLPCSCLARSSPSLYS